MKIKINSNYSRYTCFFIRLRAIAFIIFIFFITSIFTAPCSGSPDMIHNQQESALNKITNKPEKNSQESLDNDNLSQKTEIKNIKTNPETIIINFDINNNYSLDLEVFVNDNGAFNLPFKSIAKLFDTSINQNKLTKEITFTLSDGKSGTIDFQKQKIVLENKVIDLKKEERLIFLKEGILEETKDEIFIPIKILNEILDTEISQDISNYSISMKTNKLIKTLVSNNAQQNETSCPFKNNPEPDDTFMKIFTPKAKKSISLDEIKFNSHSQFFSNKKIDRLTTTRDSLLDSTTQVGLNGSLLGGEYEIRGNPRFLQNNILSPGGLGVEYKKEFKKYNLELGDISGIKTGSFAICQNILGININNEKTTKRNLQNESGLVTSGSKVNVYVNNKLISTVNTHGGYYSLKDLSSLDDKAGELKLEEVTLEGKVSKLKEDFYQPDPNLLIKGEKQFNFISGITGYNDYLFDSNNSINDYYAKKLAGGVKVGYGLTDKLTASFTGIGDHILFLPNEQNYLSKIPLNKGLASLLVNSYKDFNPIHGQTGIFSFYYALCKNLSLSTDFGISHASSIIDNEYYKIHPAGFSSVLSVKYKKPVYSLSGSVFDYSPSFYMAGSSGIGNDASYFNNRLGAELSSNINFKKLSLYGRFNGYFSNLDKKISGGLQKFNDYDFSARIPINNSSNLEYHQSGRIYGNSASIMDNETFDVDYNNRLSHSLSLNLIGNLNSFDNHSLDNDNYSSNYKTLTAKLDYTVPKDMGYLNLEHDAVMVKSNDYNSNYNSLSIGYTPPSFKRITTSLSVGYHYLGANKGLDLFASLGYIFKSGKIFQVNYQYNRQIGTFFDNIFIPTSSRHSVTFNLSDAFSLIGGNIKSVGSIKDNEGFIKVITFLDSNKNGKKEKDEPEISDIALKIPGNDFDIKTDKKGIYITRGLSEGLYKVNLDFDNLPGLLSVSPESQEEYLVKVDENKQTEVYFGLISSVGNINGKVDIKDIFNRKLDIKDLIVTVYNENGDEVKYTTVDADGNYSISGLAPGKYTIQIDKDFVKEYHLESKDSNIAKNIVIPSVYKDYVDIKDINLDYIQIIRG